MELHDLLGRRYEFTTVRAPDFTVISYERASDDCYVHFRGDTHGRQHLRLSVVLRAIRKGALVESASPPFVLERERRL